MSRSLMSSTAWSSAAVKWTQPPTTRRRRLRDTMQEGANTTMAAALTTVTSCSMPFPPAIAPPRDGDSSTWAAGSLWPPEGAGPAAASKWPVPS
jgi:hypothetical protein